MTMPSKTDMPRIYAWSHNEIVAFDTWCRNNQIYTLPNQDGWRIIDHLFPPEEALALMDAFVHLNATTPKIGVNSAILLHQSEGITLHLMEVPTLASQLPQHVLTTCCATDVARSSIDKDVNLVSILMRT